jgi:putative transposase
LQFVFADHWQMDVLILDESHLPVRLWLTLLIDGYSRGVLGMALLPESPCIESIQQALLHAIWPKQSQEKWGLQDEWSCYGIPQQLSLDNAWAHHSHSLEDLARSISMNGQYTPITLVFRPPYRGRYGAIIERLFGNFADRVRSFLPGAI